MTQAEAAQEPAEVNRRAIWAIALVGAATSAYVIRDAGAVGLFGITFTPGPDAGLLRFWGTLLIPVLIAGLVLGHQSVRKARRALRHWRLGALALVLGYAFLTVYLLQGLAVLAIVFLLPSGSGLTF